MEVNVDKNTENSKVTSKLYLNELRYFIVSYRLAKAAVFSSVRINGILSFHFTNESEIKFLIQANTQSIRYFMTLVV